MSEKRRKPRGRHRRAKCCVVIMTVGGMVLAHVTPAGADTSTATARAAQVSLLGGGVAESATVSASNAGTGSDDVQSSSESLAVLGGQTLITGGSLGAVAVARTDGTSAACAGIVGAGGALSIGSDDTCQISVGTAGSVTLELGGGVEIVADAIVASCTADSAGTTTTDVDLVNASVETALTTLLSFDPTPSANTSVAVLSLASVGLHLTSVPDGSGSVGVVAMDVDVLASVLGASIGTVTCGANHVTVPIPVFPLVAVPIVGAAMLGGAWWARRLWNTP